MMTAKERLLKNRPRKVTIDGDDFYVRSLKIGETLIFDTQAELKKRRDAIDAKLTGDLQQADRDKLEAEGKSIDDEQRKASYAILAGGLVEDDGSPCFSGADDPDLQNLPLEMVSYLVPEIVKASGAGKVETQIKN